MSTKKVFIVAYVTDSFTKIRNVDISHHFATEYKSIPGWKCMDKRIRCS
jgi:hypothetical protein